VSPAFITVTKGGFRRVELRRATLGAPHVPLCACMGFFFVKARPRVAADRDDRDLDPDREFGTMQCRRDSPLPFVPARVQ